MDLVVDANILFAALIKDSGTSDLLFKHTLYAPEFLFEEFKKYQDEIKEKTHRSEESFNELFELFKRNVILIPEEEIAPFLEKAKKISPDPKDVPYFALCLKQNCAYWTNDKKLKSQSSVKIFTTEDLIGM
ncbi:MAG: PIN domain-containing protein [Nanoarchaeota archaeon]